MRGAARDRHGLRGGMRWRRRGVRCPSIAPGQPCVLTRADDRAAAMTAQTARSRRSRLCARRQNHRTLACRWLVSPPPSVAQHTWVGRRGPCSRSKPAEAPRTERRACPVLSWRLLSCASHFRTRGCGRIARPAFRAPSRWRGRECELLGVPRALKNRGDGA